MKFGVTRVASFSASNQTWDVCLEYIDRFQLEGDWSLCILDASGTRLVSCSFCIAALAGKIVRPRLLIGCVQGCDPSINGREMFRALTRQWFGLRPKPLIVYLAQSLARTMGATNSMIVSQEAHVYSSWRYRRRAHRIRADYQGLARECGPAKPWNSWYLLGMQYRRTERKSLNAAQRRRQALLANLDAQIHHAVRGNGSEERP